MVMISLIATKIAKWRKKNTKGKCDAFRHKIIS
jgi:hypothetical protein